MVVVALEMDLVVGQMEASMAGNLRCLVERHMLAVAERGRLENQPVAMNGVSRFAGFQRCHEALLSNVALTKTPAFGPVAGLWLPRGVTSPLLPPAVGWAAIRALCSASRFFNSSGDSNFGFLGALPPLPGAGFPVAALRCASAN